MFLKQSTSVVIPFGPFVDQTDGVTLKTSLVSAIDHASTGIKLSKNGGALTIRHASVTASTYDAYGNYLVTLDATDTNTLGRLRVQFSDPTTNVPVWQDFFVLSASMYNWLVGTTAPLTPTVADRTLDVTATGAAGIDLGNVENQGTTLALSGTTIAVATALGTDAVNSTAVAASAVTEIAAGVVSAATAVPIAVDVKKVNAVTIGGAGTTLSPFGPA